MHPVIRHLLTFVGCFAATWLLASFIVMNMDVRSWTEEGRYFTVVIAAAAYLLVVRL